jgi:hypothetical protein
VEYHITEQIDGRRWEHEQSSVIDDMRRRAQQDLAAQHPGSTVTIETVHHTVRTHAGDASDTQGAATYRVDFVIEYTLGGEPNPFAA